MPNSVTGIEAAAFYNCIGLTNVTIGSGVKSIGKYAFRECGSLENVTLMDGVTDIGYGAFAYCGKIVSMVIPGSVTNIGHVAFAYCGSLAAVTFQGDAPVMGSYPFGGVSTECTAYVRRSATGWSEWGFLPIVYIEDADGGIPSVDEDVSTATVNAAVDIAGFVDAETVKKTIGGSAEKYNAFRKWAQGVGGGEQAVIASPRAAMSYALGADALIGKEITSNDVHVAGFGVVNDGSALGTTGPASFAFEIVIDGVNIGGGAVHEAVLKENLKKVLGVEGAATLSPGAFSSDNINIVFDAPANGKARFTVTPPADAGNAYFMRVKVK